MVGTRPIGTGPPLFRHLISRSSGDTRNESMVIFLPPFHYAWSCPPPFPLLPCYLFSQRPLSALSGTPGRKGDINRNRLIFVLLTEKVKLVPTSEDKRILLETMEIFNAACEKISAYAFSEKAFDIYPLHKIVYHEIRSEFHLPAQLTIRAIAKVVETYKQDKSAVHLFKKRGCLIYDSRILAIKSEDTLSLTTLSGRLNIKIQSRMPLIHRSSF